MWSRKKDEEPLPKIAVPPTPPPAAVPAKPQGVPMSSPISRNDAEASRAAATIGKSVTVSGQIFSREDLFVDGEVEGTIELSESRLTVGVNGKVKASIQAREVVILGSVNGNVEATERVDIRKDARLNGDIRTARIVIEDGAIFKGSIDIVKNEPKPVARVQTAAAASAAASANVAPAPVASATTPQQSVLTPELKR